jgi:hypothetical protein
MMVVEAPTNWMDLADWDRYWSDVLADDFWTDANLGAMAFEFTSLCHLAGVENREGHRVLLAGNGISLEPYGFAHAGCDVTVVEVSAVACRFLTGLEVTPLLLAPLFPVYDETGRLNLEKSCRRVAEEKRPGGRVAVVTGDVFRYEPEQPFHAIFSRRAYQGFPPDRREELAKRFFRWLHPGGTACVETINIIRDPRPFEEPFRAAGFREVQQWSQRGDGEKQVLFWHVTG